MFRAQICEHENGTTLKLQGRLVGAWAEQARSLFMKDSVPNGLIVDLTDVSYIDSVGEQVLNWFGSIGAEFVAKATYAAFICERLNLPLQDRLPISG
ncbi:MAG TPA: STAS domain-containing protein [Terriglobales bacterium]|nr:STAS domain-containing protein [Terriglobales bacterium]